MRVGIVGGGITGLALTHALWRVGVESVLFERADVPGGVIRTRELDGHLLELGPQRTRWVRPVRRLVDELGLDSRVLRARPGARLFIWRDGRLRGVPTTPAGVLRADLLSVPGRLRLLCEPLSGPLGHDETVAAYFRRKVGDEAYRVLFGPLMSATFASDPECMPARHSLPMLLGPLGVRRSLLIATRRRRPTRDAPACTFVGGMRELPEALAARHGARVRRGTEVVSLERAGGAVEIRLSDGGCVAVDRVVLTTPAPVTGRLLSAIAPDAADRLAGLAYHEVATVQLAVPRTPEGFGFQVAFGEELRTRGVTWSASLFGRSPVTAAAYLGGGRDPEIRGWRDERVAEVAAAEYRAVHGVGATVLAVSRASLPAYDDSWDRLEGLTLPSDVRLAANYRARLGISGRIAEAEALALALAAEGSD